MSELLNAHTSNEPYYYLQVASCAACGGGPLVPEVEDPPGAATSAGRDRHRSSVRTRCKRCGQEATFHFRWDRDVAADADDSDCINPSQEPSRIIDLGQWVSLYHMFSEFAGAAARPVEARRAARQAALCLAEALKFYRDEELPPDGAFFWDASSSAYRENPANFARTRLLDLMAMLPAPAHHAPAQPADAHDEPPAWWRFWRK